MCADSLTLALLPYGGRAGVFADVSGGMGRPRIEHDVNLLDASDITEPAECPELSIRQPNRYPQFFQRLAAELTTTRDDDKAEMIRAQAVDVAPQLLRPDRCIQLGVIQGPPPQIYPANEARAV